MIKKFYFLVLIVLNVTFIQLQAQPLTTPELQEQLTQKGDDEFIPVNIRLNRQYDHQVLYNKSRDITDRSARRNYVVNELKEFSRVEQESLIVYLEQMQSKGKVKDIKALWIGNLVTCKATPSVIQELASNKDLARLDYNQLRQVLSVEPESEKDMVSEVPEKEVRAIAWNVSKVNAPQVWDAGFSGQEVIVGVLDSGVNYNHNDLSDHMWEHPDYPNHGYNFVNNNHVTMDNLSHGTHCAGTVAGDGTAGTQTGIAPEATIMALKVLDDGGSGNESGVWEGIQFAVENGAHVMSLSLGWQHSWNPDRTMWRTSMDNALSAGVIAAVAAGNEGEYGAPPPGQVRTPGDIPPPWTSPDQTLAGGNSAVVSIGSTTSADILSGFSSKGPVTWTNIDPYNDYAYNPGIGLIRPDVTAPGSEINSLTHNSNTGYTVKSGTSMATPAVAGIMALMISKNPILTPEQISQILEETAVKLTPTKSNTFGSGRVDALAAIEATPYMGIQIVEYSLDDSMGDDNGKINPGETISLDLVLENPTEEAIENVILKLSINSPYVVLNDSIASIGDFAPGEQKQFDEIFTFEVADNIPGNHIVAFSYAAYKEDDIENKWTGKFNEEAEAPYLVFSNLLIDDSLEGNDNGRLDPGETSILRFVLANEGSLSSEDIQVNIEALSPLTILSQNQYSGPSIDSEDFIYIDFEVAIHGALAIGSTVEFDISLVSGHYNIENTFIKEVGLILEDWNSGGFEQYNWQLAGSADWNLVTNEVYEGTHAARSGLIGHNSQSELSLELDVLAADSISFYRKVSSESTYDWLEFYIDDTRAGRWSGNQDWERVAFAVESGQHTFTWIYVKDNSVSSGEDCVWIDMIELPTIAVTSAFAGFDATVCGQIAFELDAYANHYDALQWSTDGDGSFGNDSDLNTWYTPGEQDMESGTATLTIQVESEGEIRAEDSMVLSIKPEMIVELGEDQLLCKDHTLLLDAGDDMASYLWFDDSSEQTYLVDPDNFEDDAEIWVLVTNEFGCQVQDTINITFDECVNTSEPDSPNALNAYPNPASDNFTATWFNETFSSTTLRLYSFTGKVVREHQTEQVQGWVSHEIITNDLKSGIYLLSVETLGVKEIKKIIIQ